MTNIYTNMIHIDMTSIINYRPRISYTPLQVYHCMSIVKSIIQNITNICRINTILCQSARKYVIDKSSYLHFV